MTRMSTATDGPTTDLDPASTLGELVAAQPGRARVLERLGLDYCCGGGARLEDACSAAGVDVGQAVAALAEAPADEEVPGAETLAGMSLADLSAHIVRVHHGYLWEELPRLSALVEKVATVHGERHPELARLRTTYEELRAELEPHLTKEEHVLFPSIGSLEAGQPAPEPTPVITALMTEHDRAGELLTDLRAVSDGFTTPSDGCASYEAMMRGLEQLEHDTHVHIHLENNALFPRTLRLVEQA